MNLIYVKIFEGLKNWIKDPFSPENKNKTYLTAIIVLIILLLHSCGNNVSYKRQLEHEKLVSENNYEALNGKIKVLKNKKGELESVKTILYASKEQLKTLNESLYNELEKERGRVKTIVQIETVYEQAPVTVPNTIENYGQGKYGLKFNTSYRDSGAYSLLQGISRFRIGSDNSIKPDSTTILKNSLQIDVIYGVREVDNKIEVFAKSLSPNVSFNNIQGAYITDKKAGGLLPPDGPTDKIYKWTFGPQLGYTYIQTEKRHNVQAIGNLQYRMGDYTFGAQLGFGYNLGSNAPDIRTGIRIQYNIFKW
jgi:hypothetical protein